MKVLFVHEPPTAESTLWRVAIRLRHRVYTLGLLHGPGTDNGAGDWREVFTERFLLDAHSVWDVCQRFGPDVIYVHTLLDLRVLEALLETEVPCIRWMNGHN